MNKNLGRKNYETRDEYYTTEETAKRFLHYAKPEHFAGKTLYCNCDGPESEIYKLLKSRYIYYGLKKLVATKYVKDGHGIKTTFDGTNEVIEQLEGDGKYQSPECEDILRSCDVVVTNPPFSQLNKYVPFVMEHHKDVVLIINTMALMYASILPYCIRGDFVFACRFPGGAKYRRPNGDIASATACVVTTMQGMTCSILWRMYTTQQLRDKQKFTLVDNTDILECRFTADIPIDYDDVIYVPCTILPNSRIRKYFDIVRVVKEPVKVNGKGRFHRIAIKKKAGVTAEQILEEST